MEGTALRRCLEYVLDSPGREHRYPKFSQAIWPSYRNIPNHLPLNAGITTVHEIFRLLSPLKTDNFISKGCLVISYSGLFNSHFCYFVLIKWVSLFL